MSTDGLWQKPLLRPAPVTLRQTSLSRGWDLNRDLHLSTNGHYDGTEEQICGISAEFIGEMQQDLDSMELVREGKVQLVYISPLRFAMAATHSEETTEQAIRSVYVACVHST